MSIDFSGTIRHHRKKLDRLRYALSQRWELTVDDVPVDITGTDLLHLVNTKYNFRNELPLGEVLVSDLEPTDIFWDVGADVGVYTCLGASIASQTFAFEPAPLRRIQTEKNVVINDLDAEVFEIGFGDGDVWEVEGTEFPTEIADEFQRERGIPKPTVMKMDIEGGEYAALEGMTDVLEDLRILYVEIHPEMLAERGHDAAALRRHLETLGFAVEELVEHKPQQIVRYTR